MFFRYFSWYFLWHPMRLSQYLENPVEGLTSGPFTPQTLVDRDLRARPVVTTGDTAINKTRRGFFSHNTCSLEIMTNIKQIITQITIHFKLPWVQERENIWYYIVGLNPSQQNILQESDFQVELWKMRESQPGDEGMEEHSRWRKLQVQSPQVGRKMTLLMQIIEDSVWPSTQEQRTKVSKQSWSCSQRLRQKGLWRSH